MDCRRWAVDDDRSRRKWAVDEDRRRTRWAVDDDRCRRRWAVDDVRRPRRWEVDDYPSLQLPLQWRDPPPQYPHGDSRQRRRAVDHDRKTLWVAQMKASLDRIDALFADFNRSLEQVSTSVIRLSSDIYSHSLSHPDLTSKPDSTLAQPPPLPHDLPLLHPPSSVTSARHCSTNRDPPLSQTIATPPKSSPTSPARPESSVAACSDSVDSESTSDQIRPHVVPVLVARSVPFPLLRAPLEPVDPRSVRDHLVHNQHTAFVRDSPPLRPYSITYDSASALSRDQDRNPASSREQTNAHNFVPPTSASAIPLTFSHCRNITDLELDINQIRDPQQLQHDLALSHPQHSICNSLPDETTADVTSPSPLTPNLVIPASSFCFPNKSVQLNPLERDHKVAAESEEATGAATPHDHGPAPLSSRNPMPDSALEATEKPFCEVGEENNPPLYSSPGSAYLEGHLDHDELWASNTHSRSSYNSKNSMATAHECKVGNDTEEEKNCLAVTELRLAEDWLKRVFQILNHFVDRGTTVVKWEISSASRLLELKEKLVMSGCEEYASGGIGVVFITGVQILNVKSIDKANPTPCSQDARRNVSDDFGQLGVDDFLAKIDLIFQDKQYKQLILLKVHEISSKCLHCLDFAYNSYCTDNGALNVLDEMKALGVKPNSITYNNLLEAVGRGGRPWQVKNIYKEMVGKNILPNMITYYSLIIAYSQAWYFVDALTVYREIRRQSMELHVVLYNMLLLMCANIGYIDETVEIFEETKGLQDVLIRGSCLKDIVATRKGLAWLFPMYNFELEAHSCNIVMKTHCAFDQIIEGEPETNIITYNVLLDGYVKAGQTFVEFKKPNGLLDTRGFTYLLKFIVKERDVNALPVPFDGDTWKNLLSAFKIFDPGGSLSPSGRRTSTESRPFVTRGV